MILGYKDKIMRQIDNDREKTGGGSKVLYPGKERASKKTKVAVVIAVFVAIAVVISLL